MRKFAVCCLVLLMVASAAAGCGERTAAGQAITRLAAEGASEASASGGLILYAENGEALLSIRLPEGYSYSQENSSETNLYLNAGDGGAFITISSDPDSVVAAYLRDGTVPETAYYQNCTVAESELMAAPDGTACRRVTLSFAINGAAAASETYLALACEAGGGIQYAVISLNGSEQARAWTDEEASAFVAELLAAE